MELSVLSWNIWLDNQLQGPDNSGKLLQELERLDKQYNPDCIGLNEVLEHVEADSPFVLQVLAKLGYKYNHFAPASPLTEEWVIGAALASKLPLNEVEDVMMGDDTDARKRGYEDQSVKAVAAKVDVGAGTEVGIVVAHPMHLRPNTLKDHYQHTRNLAEFITSTSYIADTIVMGDFNEPLRMPRSFQKLSADYLHHTTGTRRNPTWSHNGYRFTPVRANLDRVFWSKEGSLKLVEFEVVKTRVSDHKPLFARFEIEAGSSKQ